MGKIKTRIKELRARHDLTQEDLANMVDVRRETIGHIEKGRYNLSLILAYKIAKALDSSIEEVFEFEED
ncbi:Transcriptional regulator, Xre family [Candidatus Syntrophocurvum alkaliphilum]|uniref:Transcriptional regulator, Xre family n=1 Tax=Candidatus Syntrophocurvum alkaliphilum TaxID=2293317 RepID=A0A6I6DDU8_9FIRM|nr:helix-turn-helix transcriptional regulator [Candidatus Syntrophocurvum alkaliphilum]QGU00662.1 Transcriptional regulator, Xre family [Candidatus Syntrophocurvum alkaliphilum]